MLFYELYEIENYSSLSKKELSNAEHEAGCNMLFRLLKTHFDIVEPVIYRNEHGKPYIENSSAHFNISHSNGLVACAISDEPVGVDLERIVPIPYEKMHALAKRYFTPNEYDFFKARGDERAFYYVWTRKEALSKCRGDALALSLSQDTMELLSIQTTITDDYVFSIATNI